MGRPRKIAWMVLLVTALAAIAAAVLAYRAHLIGSRGSRDALPVPRGAAAVAAVGGMIHVIGGSDSWSGTQLYTNHDGYSPQGRIWFDRAPVPDRNVWGARAQVHGGRIHLLGGWSAGGNAHRIYDPREDAWTTGAPIPTSHLYGHGVAALGGEIFVIGGTGTSAVSILDVASGTWRTGASIPTTGGGLAAWGANGRVYVVGAGPTLSIYDPARDRWLLGAPLPIPVHAPGIVGAGGHLFVFGGASIGPGSQGDRTAIQTYDIAADRWRVAAQLRYPRSWPAVALEDGRIHVIGGFDGASSATAVHEVVKVSRLLPREP